MEHPTQGLFRDLNGTPAHALIIIGLVFLLGAPLIPQFKSAGVARAYTEFNQVDALMELDLEDLRRAQERERKEEQEEAQKESAQSIDYSQPPEEIERLQKQRSDAAAKRMEKENERQKAFEDKKEELKKKYDAHERRRTWLKAQIAATGMRWHLVILFLGNVMLLVGLLVVTLENTGATQKVALIILLVAMFSALSGVSLNFLTLGSLGDRSGAFEQMMKEAPKAQWQP